MKRMFLAFVCDAMAIMESVLLIYPRIRSNYLPLVMSMAVDHRATKPSKSRRESDRKIQQVDLDICLGCLAHRHLGGFRPSRLLGMSASLNAID